MKRVVLFPLAMIVICNLCNRDHGITEISSFHNFQNNSFFVEATCNYNVGFILLKCMEDDLLSIDPARPASWPNAVISQTFMRAKNLHCAP